MAPARDSLQPSSKQQKGPQNQPATRCSNHWCHHSTILSPLTPSATRPHTRQPLATTPDPLSLTPSPHAPAPSHP